MTRGDVLSKRRRNPQLENKRRAIKTHKILNTHFDNEMALKLNFKTLDQRNFSLTLDQKCKTVEDLICQIEAELGRRFFLESRPKLEWEPYSIKNHTRAQ